VQQIFKNCQDPLVLKQLAFQIGRQRVVVEDLSEELMAISQNQMLSDFYQQLAKELDILEPKHPYEIYKIQQEKTKGN